MVVLCNSLLVASFEDAVHARRIAMYVVCPVIGIHGESVTMAVRIKTIDKLCILRGRHCDSHVDR